MTIIDHTHPVYRQRWARSGASKFNGAYYYSREIVERMIPAVRTDRNWITVNQPGYGCDHAIVFIHNNKHPDHYEWLKRYKDLVLVCGVPETVKKVEHIGHAVYLPLSIDVEEVRKHRREKTKDTAFVGRPSKRKGIELPAGTDFIEGLPREELLDAMAEYRQVYAVGRCALEAAALGCKILPYDPRFPDPKRWIPLDTLDAAKILQQILDWIDGGKA